MRSNQKHSAKELEKFIQLNLEGVSYRDLQESYGLLLSETVFRQYRLKYLEYGLSALESHKHNQSYSQSFKEAVVKEHLETQTPIEQLARKYQIPAASTVRNWLIKYTKGEENKDYIPKPEVYRMNSQKKTTEEKLEIVKDFLETGMSYKQIAEKYQVSYHNLYSWVQKYRKHGPDGLIDGRGRRKPEKIQTEEEKLKTEIAALKARNDYLETENAALKKLKEVERELMLQEQHTKRNSRRLRNFNKKDTK